jgi:HIRAN domain-containing protein
MSTMRHFFASVAGESYRNDDGSDRQAIIATCRVGEALVLEAEPDNPHDENAVRVLREDGKQIGYLEWGTAARLVDDLSDFRAFVAGVGRGRGPYLGVSLLVIVGGGEDDAAVETHARRVLEAEGNLGHSADDRGPSGIVAGARELPGSDFPWVWVTVVAALVIACFVLVASLTR